VGWSARMLRLRWRSRLLSGLVSLRSQQADPVIMERIHGDRTNRNGALPESA
jgi:hypothetical protein